MALGIIFGEKASDPAAITARVENPLLRILQYRNSNHERRVAKVVGSCVPRSREPVDEGDLLECQNLECERLKIVPENEMLRLGLLAARIDIDHLLAFLFRCHRR